MKFRILIFVLIAAMLLGLVSCKNNTTDPSVTDPAESASESSLDSASGSASESGSETQAPGVADLDLHELIKDGNAEYYVIRPENASEDIKSAASDIYKTLSNLVGAGKSVNYTVDMDIEYLKTKTHSPDIKAILVGDTNYEESAEGYNGLGYGDWRITTVGNKIVVAGYSKQAIYSACSKLCSFINRAKDSNGNVTLKRETIETETTQWKTLNAVPKYEGKDVTVNSTYYSGDDCYVAIFDNANEATHTEYTTKLQNEGFTKYTDRDMNGNLFATYTKDEYILNVMLTPKKKQARVIIETNAKTTLPELKSENTYNTVCTPMFFEVGVSRDDSKKQNGMCFLFRLSDGSFVVFDGGLQGELNNGEQYRQNARRIYEIINEYAPDKNNLVIKAWIITHGHDDHIGALQDFIPSYAKKVKIEHFLHNFPEPGQASKTPTGTNRADDVMSKLATYTKQTKITRVHPGYVFYFADAEIEFFYTLEMFAPGDLTYYNTSSLVGRVSLGGQTFMMTGDMSPDANSIICKLYGTYLKSDIVQVAHHGYRGGTTQFYSYVNPRWAFWPINASEYEGLKTNERNEYFLKGKVEGVFVAKFKTYAVNIPFDGTNLTVSDNKLY